MESTHTPANDNISNLRADTRAIFDDVKTFVERFVRFADPDHATTIALWVLHTHAFEAAYTTPYLYITSAEKRSGKTRTIETVAMLARNCVSGADLTGPALFKAIELARPTVLIDEVDAIFAGAAREDLRGVLNSGYKQGGKVLRAGSIQSDELLEFNTFAPKLLAGIDNGQLPDTVADRSIKIVLRRRSEDETPVERLVARKAEPEAEELRKRIEAWAAEAIETLSEMECDPINEIGDRQWDIAEPLVNIGVLAGLGPEVRAAMTNLLADEGAALSINAQVLAAAREIFEESGSDRITSESLSTRTGHSAKRIGVLLKPYEIRPTTIRFGGAQAKGYFKADFEDAWKRYL